MNRRIFLSGVLGSLTLVLGAVYGRAVIAEDVGTDTDLLDELYALWDKMEAEEVPKLLFVIVPDELYDSWVSFGGSVDDCGVRFVRSSDAS